ncbi:multifunctional CCA addition/repair protein [Ningiella sp. W23]|uniref:multifunctional CCA addition/repair protein n=1 Tax=Ningiella sp. W23 TaxID=3023715 RepID=UPI00375725C6
MKTYLVGGAVRDQLLGRAIKERDYVVVGATVKQMLDLGFVQVGKDFPVFLHPKSKEEYALARTERKKGTGYTGFECDTSSSITLEQDLLRRDLTVNAMAQDEMGNIIDPFGGQKDLKNRILRHVSDAFSEDPLRVLRVARFAARYHYLGFGIASETLDLMRSLSTSGELETLSAERVWQESAKSLMENDPQVYFTTLKSVNALSYWFKELDVLWGVPNPSKWHPEIDTGLHTMMVIKQAALAKTKLAVRYAALTHDYGKALTDVTQWPSHHGHDDLGLSAIKACSKRLSVPNDCKELALLVSEHHSVIHRVQEKSAEEIINVFEKADAFRRKDRFKLLLDACKCDFLGRKDFASKAYPQQELWLNLLDSLGSIDAQAFVKQGLQGSEIRDAIRKARLESISNALQ